MAGASITVIANSLSLRESVSVALAARYRLTFASAGELSMLPPCDLLIVAADEALPPALESELARRAHLRWPTGAPPASPERLRLLVRDRLAGAASQRWPHWLAYPAIPRTAEALAARAGLTDLPVLITGEAGCGKRRLARQIHATSGTTSLLVVAATDLAAATLENALRGEAEAGRTTLLVTEIAGAPAAAYDLLARILEEGGVRGRHGWRAARLICTSTSDADELAVSPSIDRDLFYRLAVLPIHLPPLRQRRDDVAALARDIVQRAPTAAAPTAPPQLSSEALARIERYPWPGNLAEMESVLCRSALLCDGATLEADDLVFDPTALEARPVARPAATTSRLNGSAPPPAARLELIVNELAHELKNPMVTIKTLAQHLARQLGGDEDDREMARMTGDAVDRLDRSIENLLRFARFEKPCPGNVALAAIAGDCLEGVAHDLDEQRVLLDDRVGPTATAYVDRSQVTFALESLLRAVVRAAGERTTCVVRTPRTRCGLVLEFPQSAGSVTSKLARWADGGAHNGAVEPSMHFMFGKALIERNGGSVSVQVEDGRTAVLIDLPQGKDESDEDEEAAYLDR